MTSLQQRLEGGLNGRYAIERELGQGGMAIVFLALHLDPGYEPLRSDSRFGELVRRIGLT